MRLRPVLLLLGASLVAVPFSATPDGLTSTSQAAACTPTVQVLPLAPGDLRGNLVAMNDQGWAVGTSEDLSGPQDIGHTLLWRGPGAPVDLGLGTHVNEDGSRVTWEVIDINNDGVVAMQRFRRIPGGVTRASAHLWHDGEATRLPGGRPDNDVTISGLNDHGTAVGTLDPRRPGAPARAVIWRDVSLIHLPVPRGTSSTADQINNFGLVTGGVLRPGQHLPRKPWFWRLGGGSGPISVPDGHFGLHSLIDDRDQIAMTAERRGRVEQLLFRGPRSEPTILDHRRIDAMNDGDVVGHYEDDHLSRHQAWVATLHSSTRHLLPPPDVVPPEAPAEEFGWDSTNIYARTVTRGVSDFAPQGGVTVGGTAKDWENNGWPTIWTCVATS